MSSNQTRLSACMQYRQHLKHFKSTKVEYVMFSLFKQIRPFTTSLNLREASTTRLRDTKTLALPAQLSCNLIILWWHADDAAKKTKTKRKNEDVSS